VQFAFASSLITIPGHLAVLVSFGLLLLTTLTAIQREANAQRHLNRMCCRIVLPQ
jgi:hypothetical protein